MKANRGAILMKTTVILALAVLAGTALAQCNACGGCAKAAAAAPVESEHCHFLEVTSAVADGPAARAGIRTGDVLVKYNGLTVGCRTDLDNARENTPESVPVVFRRGEKELSFLLPKGKLGIYFAEWQKDIVPDPDARIIPDVPATGWDKGMNSFMGALAALQWSAGDRIDYPYLCGVSGAAFRLHFFDTWCPSSPDPTCGFDAAKVAMESRGLRWREYDVAPDGKNKPQVLAAIKTSIDSGMPVLAIDLIEMPEWGVITGYQKAGDDLFCRTYFDKRKGYEIARKFPRVVLVLEKKHDKVDDDACIRPSFRIVADNLTIEKYGEYYSGLAAFDKWIARLKTDDFTKLDSAQLSNAVQANNWIFNRLIADRKTGMEYLDLVAERLPETEPRVADLTAFYQQEVDLLEPLLERLPCPSSVTRPEQWTREIRDEEAAVLNRARALEAQALVAWKELAGGK
jgi:hypothetical protein